MKLLSAERYRTHVNGRPVVNGFLSYIHPTRPELMLCTGFEDYSDGYDDFELSLSRDKGQTWTPPRPWLKSRVVPGGRLRYAEPAALFDPDTGKLVVLVDENLYPDDQLDTDSTIKLIQTTYDPASGEWTPRQHLDLTPGRYLAMSFSFPIKTSKGALLFPAMRPLLDETGKPVHYQGCWATADESLTVIGEYGADGELRWQVGAPVPVDLEKSSRGLNENTLAELRDGRIAMICRGDNSMYPERPGYKWLSFSEDNARTWSVPVPLPCDKGDPLESSATGSALFRSPQNGKLYWLGNLCIQGERPKGNYPRVPLVVAEVQEEPFALRRDTIAVVGQRQFGEPAQVQMSNFRFYVDRETGDLVVFVTRYAERNAKDWMIADYYRYRVELA
ncbi:MAG: exo-alpha-sialidase [Candidatus Latescibacteria bacterium]|nr:exo-alpha-sialidase [Candidatus Latescibacterota bacterium]